MGVGKEGERGSRRILRVCIKRGDLSLRLGLCMCLCMCLCESEGVWESGSVGDTITVTF